MTTADPQGLSAEFTRDGETFGGWDGSLLPVWLQDQLAPLNAEYRAKRLSVLLLALKGAEPRSEGPQPPAVKVDEGVLIPKAALDWLFGLGDSFEPQPGQRGNFWWRSEFRRRAGLPSLGSRHEG